MTRRPPLRRADGYALCRDIGDGTCSCEDWSWDPCASIGRLLRAAGRDVKWATKRELDRIEVETSS